MVKIYNELALRYYFNVGYSYSNLFDNGFIKVIDV